MRTNKAWVIAMGALLWGFAWQIRGNGTSDPAVVIMLFLLFLAIHYSPRKKFHLVVFGFATLVFRLLRTGWGTFVGQAGIPGLYPGHIGPDQADILSNNIYDVVVPWWHGYFWLFIVGLAWASFPSFLFGGYFFTTFKYTLRDLAIAVLLFVAGKYLGGLIAEQLIPFMAPGYYKEIYEAGLSTRNYRSMHGNLSTAMATVPVLLYVDFGKRDPGFVKRSIMVMGIFGTALSAAAIWHPIGRNHLEWGLPAWSLWEYFSGLIMGGLIFLFYSRFSEDELRESDLPSGIERLDDKGGLGQFVVYAMSLYFFFIYGLQESVTGSYSITCAWLEIEPFVSQGTIKWALLAGVLVPYYLYRHGYWGAAWLAKPLQEKCLAALVVLLPLNFFCFLAPFVVSGLWSRYNSAAFLDTLSFLIVEGYAIYLCRQFGQVAGRAPSRPRGAG